MNDCIFCKIIDKKIPSQFFYEDENMVIIKDIHPQAKKHFLALPKKHIHSLEDLFFSKTDVDAKKLIGDLFNGAIQFAKSENLLPDGFRSVINTNSFGGQTVYHLHLHLLGGEPLSGGFGR